MTIRFTMIIKTIAKEGNVWIIQNIISFVSPTGM